jgi:2-dehydropantoate 2-reductase
MKMIETVIETDGVNPANQPTSPRYCIFGAGAIGGTIAARLARTDATVSIVARGDTLAAIQKNGLRLVSNGETLQMSVRASADPAKLGPQDYVIVAVKAPSLPEVALRIGPLLGTETVVVTAMNGVPWWFLTNARGLLPGMRLTAVDPGGIISCAIPASRVIGCVVYMSCAIEAPGVIRHAAGRRLIVGEPDKRSSRRVARLAEWLRRSGFDCVESTDIRRDIWFKLWGNLSMNPISLLTGATLDRIVADPLAHTLCSRMMEEAGRIGEAIGIPATVPVEEMFNRARALGAVKTSMLQDAEHGKPVEIDALLSVTRDLGRMVGVPTPFIDSVLGLARLKATSSDIRWASIWRIVRNLGHPSHPAFAQTVEHVSMVFPADARGRACGHTCRTKPARSRWPFRALSFASAVRPSWPSAAASQRYGCGTFGFERTARFAASTALRGPILDFVLRRTAD